MWAESRVRCIWRKMRERCNNKNFIYYKMYGGRGISVCDEWSSSAPFIKWALNNGYTDVLTLDRINNDGNYEPGNCRWVTMKVQCNNRSDNVFIEHNGCAKTIAQWSDDSGIGVATL